jgi:hypothetical protein
MTSNVNSGKAKANRSKLTPVAAAKAVDREERRRRVAEILARIDALPLLDEVYDLEWDENGLPI